MSQQQFEAFQQQIYTTHRHVANLHQQAAQTPAYRNELLTSSLEELNAAMAKLQIAGEMLSWQADQLAAASDIFECWRYYYGDLLDFVPDACVVSDLQGTVQEANRAAADLLGAEQNALLGRSLIDYIAEGEGHSFRSKLLTLQQNLLRLESQEQKRQEWEVVLCPHGRPPCQALINVRVVLPARHDQPHALRWLMRSVPGDNTVTQVPHAQSEIETKLMALFHANIIGMIAGEGDMIIEANDCFLRMVGCSSDDLPLNAKNMTPPKQRLRSAAAMQEAIATGTSAPFEKEFISKEGRHVPTVIGGYCLTANPYQYINFVLDITERKRREEQMAADYTREHRIAETFQKALLPDVAGRSFPGLAVATLYAAAWEEAQVGGDFYDAFALDDGKIALVVGDVAGKGLAAAVYASEVKSALRAFLREHPHPAIALTRLNAFVYDHLHLDDLGEDPQSNQFTTLALAVVEPNQGKAAFAVAGAEPPLVIRADGSMEVVNAGILILGVQAKLEYEATEVALHPGDRILMVTDGITEARSGSDFLDYEGFVALVAQSLEHGTLQDMVQAILDGACAFAGGTLADDACLLVAQRL